MKRFLDLADFSREQVLDLLALAQALQDKPQPRALAGKVLGLVFFNPSLRTLASFQSGMARLGGSSFVITPGQGTWHLETQLHAMRPGMKVRLVPDIDPDAAVDGVVDSLAPATGALFSLLPPENATGNFTKVVQRIPVKLRIDPNQAEHATWLRAGLSVTADVDTRGPDAIRLGWWGSALAAIARPRK